MRDNIEVILIGGSAGSGRLLEIIIKSLPKDFKIPLVIVRHISEGNSLKEYYNLLSEQTGKRIREVEDKELMSTSTTYFSPPGYHMLIEEDRHFALDISAKSNYSRPSIDVLFRSAAKVFKSSVVSIILSGANDDGAMGTVAVKNAGGLTIAQNPSNAPFPKMVDSAIKTGKIDLILTIDEIIYHIIELDSKSRGIL